MRASCYWLPQLTFKITWKDYFLSVILNKGGPLSRAILKKTGDGIQQELDLGSDKEMRMTSGGRLPVKKIIHIVVQGKKANVTKSIKEALYKCDEAGCQSVALPALGTGWCTSECFVHLHALH